MSCVFLSQIVGTLLSNVLFVSVLSHGLFLLLRFHGMEKHVVPCAKPQLVSFLGVRVNPNLSLRHVVVISQVRFPTSRVRYSRNNASASGSARGASPSTSATAHSSSPAHASAPLPWQLPAVSVPLPAWLLACAAGGAPVRMAVGVRIWQADGVIIWQSGGVGALAAKSAAARIVEGWLRKAPLSRLGKEFVPSADAPEFKPSSHSPAGRAGLATRQPTLAWLQFLAVN